MFDVGFWELTLIGLISLLVLGPQRLPGAVRTTALWLRRARQMAATVKAEIEHELALEDVKSSLERDQSFRQLKALERELRRPVEVEPRTGEGDSSERSSPAAAPGDKRTSHAATEKRPRVVDDNST
ncbi:Sec-independent protein translocase protein TatB [Methylohalobius crimeensis]|uniref:Sec-independent protein translocase protein TatB n=1 Tax=Methylohalobius crimeensis TaxID=244365 RepID=UPI0003B34CF3|nr:Sec-independent protein translocase protein TatB [Methylohalobius crimeensis]